jgi:flagellar protein FliS
MTMAESASSHKLYRQVNVETASQGKLVVMLFDGAIQRAEKAKQCIESGNTGPVHNHLIRAQDIVAELRGALNMEAGEVAQNLDRIYEYFQHLLIKANVRKDTAPLAEAIELMVEMRETWSECFKQVSDDSRREASSYNSHGASLMNIQG